MSNDGTSLGDRMKRCHSDFVMNGSHFPCRAEIMADGTHPNGLHRSAIIWEDSQSNVEPPNRALLTWEGQPEFERARRWHFGT